MTLGFFFGAPVIHDHEMIYMVCHQPGILAGQPANELGSPKTTTFFAPRGSGWLVAFPAGGSVASAALPVTVKTAIQMLNVRVVFMVIGFILKAVAGVE